MPLRPRFALVIGGLVAVILILFSCAFLFMEKRHIGIQQEKIQKVKVEQLARACVQARISHDELAVLRMFQDMRAAPEFREAMCVDGEGRVTLDSSLRRLGERPAGMTLSAQTVKTIGSEDGTNVWVYDALAESGGVVGGARIIVDSGPPTFAATNALRTTVLRLGVAGAGIFAIAIGLSFLTARALTRPIQKLVAGARQVGKGEWEARVETDAPGELAVLASEFNAMAEKLGALDRLKDQFVHAVSHDLRNPLGAILASARGMAREGLPASSKTLVEVIETAATRLNAMVNNILDVACLQEHALSYERRPFILAPLLHELTRLYEPLAKETDRKIRVESPPDLPRLLADEEKVFRVFLNLLANAVKFTRRRDSITLSARVLSSEWVECAVVDTGPGIAPDRLAGLFMPFQSRRGADAEERRRQGAGLGLSLVKALVEGHGGQIRVESALGRGTSVFFSLPAETR